MVSVLISSEIFSSLLIQDSDNITTNNNTKTFFMDDFFLKISSKLNKICANYPICYVYFSILSNKID